MGDDPGGISTQAGQKLLGPLKWKVQADHRESRSRLFELVTQDSGFDVDVGTLRAGDYFINDRILVERKTHSDFAISIIDGRLFHQAAMLAQCSQRSLLLVEGPKPERMPAINPKALKGALLSLAVSWKLPVVFSRSPDESLMMLHILAEQSQALRRRTLRSHGLRPRRSDLQRLFVLQGLPGVGPGLATRLLRHFKSVEKVMQATQSDLEQVPGCGPHKAASIRALLGGTLTR